MDGGPAFHQERQPEYQHENCFGQWDLDACAGTLQAVSVSHFRTDQSHLSMSLAVFPQAPLVQKGLPTNTASLAARKITVKQAEHVRV